MIPVFSHKKAAVPMGSGRRITAGGKSGDAPSRTSPPISMGSRRKAPPPFQV